MADLRERLQKMLGEAYTLDRELGGGGMSRVYVATETAFGRKVVVKVLPPEVAAGVKSARFQREIHFLARLTHPHIVPLLAAGGDGSLFYYVMPFMQGESLRSRIIQHGELPVGQVVRTLREVASALAYAHGNGIVHRDIKPDNVLLSGGSAMVTDFGVAKALSVSTGAGNPNALTSLGIALGTPSYIAPEQATADPTMDHRADLYSLGAMAYEMLAGRPPFLARTPQAMLAAHINEVPVPLIERRPRVPLLLNTLIMSCLEKAADRRPQLATEVIDLLDAVVAPHENEPPPPTGDSSDSAHGGIDARAGFRMRIPVDKTSRRALTIAAALAVVALGYLVPRLISRGKSQPLPAVAAPALPSAKSIAVLPLANVNGGPENEYFSDGISDEIMIALSGVPGLRVASRTSAFAFKGKSLDAREIGRRLNVGALLEGSVRRDGDQLRVQVQLTSATDNLALWSGSYERRTRDVFSIQDSIAQAVVEALSFKLTSDELARLSHGGTVRVDALDSYLKGRFFVNRNTEPDIRKGLGYYQLALAADPNFARAWAGVAFAWIALADDYVAPRDAYPRAKAAALNAMRIDPSLAEARAALGAVELWHDWDFDKAATDLREAIRLDPEGVYAYRYYGNLLKARGQFDLAMTVIRRAEQLEPLSPGRINSVALMYTTMGQFDRAIQTATKALEIDSTYADAFLAIGNALLAQGKPAVAISEFSRAPKMENRMRSGIAAAEAMLGHRDAALKIAKELEAEEKRHYIGPEAIAAVYFSLGDRDKGFQLLEKAYNVRSAYMVLLRSDRRWDAVRTDPRFIALLRKVGA